MIRNIINNDEICDNGADNGLICNPVYGEECTYCSSGCTEITVTGSNCGDSEINGSETCDDGLNNGNICNPADHYDVICKKRVVW